MEKPLFSILMANYNNGIYLMDAIESVRKQTYANWEIVLVDDSSTDNSEEIYRELEKDERIHIYRNENNKGCGYTKRRCAELATGELCGFLDPDDALLPEAIETMVVEHNKFPKASLIYSCHVIADEHLENQRIVKGNAVEEGKTYLESTEGGPTHFASFKRDLYKKTKGIDSKFIRAVDQDLYFKLEEVGELKYVNQPLYIYRQGTGSNISLGNLNVRKALCWDMIAMVDACQRRNLSIDQIAFTHVLREMDEIAEISAWEKEKQMKSSKEYRMGKTMLAPIRLFNKIFRKN